MAVIDATFVTAMVSIIGAIIWLVRLEGRINGHDGLFAEREKQTNERQADIKERLERIEDKIVQGFNGKLKP